MTKRLTHSFVCDSFEKEGYILLSDTYKNARTKLFYECPKGHLHSITWADWYSGHRCPYCFGNAKIKKTNIKNIFKEEGYKVISINKNLGRHTVYYECPEGHKHKVRFDHFIRGIRCPYCSGRIKKDIVEIKKEMFLEKYTLMSDKYEGVFKPLKLKCQLGHEYSATYHSWDQGRRCPVCNGGVPFTEEEVKRALRNDGYKLLSSYTNSLDTIKVLCPNDHEYTVRYNNWLHKNSRCIECSGAGSSSAEVSIRKLLDSLGVIYRTNDRSLITPYELDLTLPNYNIAIEYCGLYWHSELMGKDKNYHVNKLDKCIKAGYKLITIFEDEWLFKQEIVISRISNLINAGKATRLYARKCYIKEISSKEARVFCEENHLQGYGAGSRVKLGAFSEGTLVSVMTFAKPSLAKGSRLNKTGVWELHRFCNKKNFNVVGVASKLLKYFQRNFEWDTIFSFADRRWSVGNLYDVIGFNFDSFTTPNYWYIKNKKRIHRFALRKTKEDSTEITEWEIRKSQGYNRIWDCGNIKYIIKNMVRLTNEKNT